MAKNLTKVPQGKGEVRIIAGLWRGRKLPVLLSQGLRPTSDRVRETLFNWLMNDIVAANCLDCFAGSGALGFEALSRQAAKVVMLEKSPVVAKQLKQNLQQLKTQNGEIICIDTLTYLAQHQPEQPFNIVFLDPPFHQDLLNTTLTLLETHHWLADDALIYLESEKTLQDIAIPTNWHLLKEKFTQQVAYRLYQKTGVAE
ncbi:16S rRNA methyltransferase [Gallibacterium salpingitidis]|uniref:Ribosomal RNA small subunit methyltransferase D n=1 Tax=Gallibacterium salpingitidis TaxID=505341 RepID=A0AB36E5P5_9PAST|nr:16S rRNA (guanine(966)-N(2))-methyltransferase RsmD [Gallibacterium salpingitidis]OBX12071.1 16S rRNA methyltransferase [Gallibacterium salpingitidis]